MYERELDRSVEKAVGELRTRDPLLVDLDADTNLLVPEDDPFGDGFAGSGYVTVRQIVRAVLAG